MVLMSFSRVSASRGEGLGSAGQGSQGPGGGGGPGVPGGVDPEAGGDLDAGGAGRVAELLAQDLGGGDDQGEQLVLGDGGGVDRGAAGGQQDRGGLPVAGGAGGAERGTGQCLAGGADRVQGVGLRAVTPRGPFGPVELDDDLAGGGQVSGQAGAVAPGALDGPHPGRGLLVGPRDQVAVAGAGGGHGLLVDDRAGAGIDDGRGVGLDMGVDADDDVGEFGQTGHCVPPLHRTGRDPVREESRQDCDGTRRR